MLKFVTLSLTKKKELFASILKVPAIHKFWFYLFALYFIVSL